MLYKIQISLLQSNERLNSLFELKGVHPLTSYRKKIAKTNLVSTTVAIKDFITLSPLTDPVRGESCSHWDCINRSNSSLIEGKICLFPFCQEPVLKVVRDEYLALVFSDEKINKDKSIKTVIVYDKSGIYKYLNSEGLIIEGPQEAFLLNTLVNTLFDINKKRNSFLYKRKFKVRTRQVKLELDDMESIYACRSTLCLHLKCFDLLKLYKNIKNIPYKVLSCPICHITFTDNELYLDEDIVELLSFIKENNKSTENVLYLPLVNRVAIDSNIYNKKLQYLADTTLEEEIEVRVLNNFENVEEIEEALLLKDEGIAIETIDEAFYEELERKKNKGKTGQTAKDKDLPKIISNFNLPIPLDQI